MPTVDPPDKVGGFVSGQLPSLSMMLYDNSLTFARRQDEADPLRNFRDKFHHPVIDGRPTVYFTGNSLGLQPKTTADYVNRELEDWQQWGVEGHFHARRPWLSYHRELLPKVARLVGAQPHEVTVMNSLTVNLHLMMATFYRPTPSRYKIMVEGAAFCSDHYAVQSQARHHGFDPDEAIIALEPRPGEHTLRTADIEAAIEEAGDSLAVLLLGGVNYYTGQLFDMARLTRVAHRVGATAGFDLAHAIGNAHLNLHDWNVDFATWCSYKYLNSSPGGVSGVYLHERHATNTELPRLAGWWGYDEATRFEMKRTFEPSPTADGWQLSNVPVLLLAAHNAALDVFEEAGLENLCEKSDRLTGYLEFLIDEANEAAGGDALEIITPRDRSQRAAQLSILAGERGRAIFDELSRRNIIVDWREPNVIRLAPVPLYNSFEDVYHFGRVLNEVVSGAAIG